MEILGTCVQHMFNCVVIPPPIPLSLPFLPPLHLPPSSPLPPFPPPTPLISILIDYFPEIVFLNFCQGIAKELISPAYVARAGIFKESMGARNRIQSLESIPGLHKHLKIRVLAIHRLAEFIP
jgi:hypothetical protein